MLLRLTWELLRPQHHFYSITCLSFLAGEALQKKFIVGFVLAIAGIAMISFNSATQLQINPLGDFLALAAAATWAVYAVLSKKSVHLVTMPSKAHGILSCMVWYLCCRHCCLWIFAGVLSGWLILSICLICCFRCRSVGDVLRDLEYGSQAAGSY